MEKETIEQYLAVYDRAKEDPVYLSLLEELRAADSRLLDAFEKMAPAHRDAVMDYLGAVHAIHARLLVLSCLCAEKS